MEVIMVLGTTALLSCAFSVFAFQQSRIHRVQLDRLQREFDQALAAAKAAFEKEKEALTKAPVPSLTAEEILHDLTKTGQTLVRIERVDGEHLFLRRPRG